MGYVPGLLGLVQATEAIQLLLGRPSKLSDATLLVDLREWSLHRVSRRRAPECPVCGSGTQRQEIMIEVTLEEGKALSDAIWIDVREPFEVRLNPGPADIPFRRIPLGKLKELPAGNVVIVCAHGMRSGSAARKFRAQGREDVYSLDGGLAAL